MYLLWIFLATCAIQFVNAVSQTGTRLLVVIEEAAEKTKYATFWNDLDTRGYQITYSSPKSETLSLFQHGARLFDHIILLPPKSKGLGPALTPKLLLQFVNEGGNILLTLAADAPTPAGLSSLLVELDVHLPPDRTSVVIDHFNFDQISAANQHDVLILSQNTKNLVVDGEGSIVFPRAVGQELGARSPLLTSILHARDTAYISSLKDDSEYAEDPFAVGTQISLVTAMQARNSARFTIFGSLEALEDKWFDAKIQAAGGKASTTANRKLARQITAWTFQEIGVLEVGRVQHYLQSLSADSTTNASVTDVSQLNPSMYRIKNDVTFEVELSEYIDGVAKPFVTKQNDAVQVEFTMLSPFHRLDMAPVSRTDRSTIYSSTFRLPDQHGIFRFEVNYKRPLYTNIDVKREVTVRHFAHDEWPRSWEISAGWVWIAGIWVTIVGWLAFVALWLWSAPTREADKIKKRQ